MNEIIVYKLLTKFLFDALFSIWSFRKVILKDKKMLLTNCVNLIPDLPMVREITIACVEKAFFCSTLFKEVKIRMPFEAISDKF